MVITLLMLIGLLLAALLLEPLARLLRLPFAALLVAAGFIGSELLVVLDGESLLNDTLVIVLFSLLMALALDPAQTVDWNRSLAHFALLLGGGIAVGLATGGAAVLLLRLFHGATGVVIFTLFIQAPTLPLLLRRLPDPDNS